MSTIHIETDDRTIPVSIDNSATERSPHTGHPLWVIEGRTYAVGDEMHDWFSNVLENQPTEGFWSHPHPEYGRRRWRLRRGNYSIRNDRYEYHVTLRESELFVISSLEINGLVLGPLRYSEELNGDALIVDALVVVSGEEREQLREWIETGARFPVVRHGINEEPVQMRFGMCGWSEHGEKYKYLLHLVDLRYDVGQTRSSIVSLEQLNRQDWLAFEMAFSRKLGDILVEKGILTADEIAAIREDAHREIARYRHHFIQVADAETLDW